MRRFRGGLKSDIQQRHVGCKRNVSPLRGFLVGQIPELLAHIGAGALDLGMALPHLAQEEFERLLNEHVRPSRAVESIEHLYDRERQLNRIEEALSSTGRHVFIYGDRGAGHPQGQAPT